MNNVLITGATGYIAKNLIDEIKFLKLNYIPVSRSSSEKIYKKLEKIPLLYGGSVSAENIEEIMSLSYLSGCLVGNSSLDGKEFANIAKNF